MFSFDLQTKAFQSMARFFSSSIFGTRDDVTRAGTSIYEFMDVLQQRVEAMASASLPKQATAREQRTVAAAAARTLIRQVAEALGVDLDSDAIPAVDEPEKAFVVMARHAVTLASLSCDAYSQGDIPADVDGYNEVILPYISSLDYVRAWRGNKQWPADECTRALARIVLDVAISEGWLAAEASGSKPVKSDRTSTSTSPAAPAGGPARESGTRTRGVEAQLSAILMAEWHESTGISSPKAVAAALATKDQHEMARALYVEASKAVARRGHPAHLAGFIAAQAIAETGWGASIPRTADVFSWNALGIKKRSRHQTGVVNTTQEFVNGKGLRVEEEFAVFESFADCFDDYLYMMENFPRYKAVLQAKNVHEFAQALSDGGYATDPAYVKLVTGVFNGRTWKKAMDPAFLAQVSGLVLATVPKDTQDGEVV